MARQYTHIKQYEDRIAQMHQKGQSYRQIGETLGFSKEQVKECLRRPRRLAARQKAMLSKRVGKACPKRSIYMKYLRAGHEEIWHIGNHPA